MSNCSKLCNFISRALPRWTPARHPCGNRSEFHLRIFSLVIISYTIAAAAAQPGLKATQAGKLLWRALGLWPRRSLARWVPRQESEGRRGSRGERGRADPAFPSLSRLLAAIFPPAASLNMLVLESFGILEDAVVWVASRHRGRLEASGIVGMFC